MSYILDALKKAERERGIAKVPTLATVHDVREKPPIRLWAVAGVAVLCIAVFAWLFFIGLDADNEATPSPAKRVGNIAAGPDPKQAKAPVSADESSFAVNSSESRTIPDLGYSGERPSLADEAGIKMADRQRREPAINERKVTQSERAETAGHAETIPSSSGYTPESAAPELTELPPPQPREPAARIEEPKPSSDAIEEGQVSLRDAIEEMNMSILFYSENKAERLVFINGRKYVEGDTVEGRYLLESITQEGAVLRYSGGRAMLRPGRN